MTLGEIVQLLANRLATLNIARSNAFALGDADRVAAIETEIAETEDTLARIRAL